MTKDFLMISIRHSYGEEFSDKPVVLFLRQSEA